MRVDINGQIYNLKEIQWKEGATYLLTIPKYVPVSELIKLQGQLFEFIKTEKLNIKFLIITEGMVITEKDLEKELRAG